MKGLKRLRIHKRNQLILALLMVIVLSIGFYMNSKPLYIGFVGGFSGHWSQLGVQTRDGFLQAVEDINDGGGIRGRRIIPVVVDDRNDNDYTHFLLEEMAAKEVDFIVGFTVSAMTPSIERYGQDPSFLFVAPTVSANALTGIDDQFLRVCNPSAYEARIIIDTLAKEDNHDIAIVYDVSNMPYTVPTKDIIIESADSMGFNIVHEMSFNSKNVSFDPIIDKLNQAKPDQIVVLASACDTAEIAQRLKAIENQGIIYACAWATTNDLLGLGGHSLEGVRVIGLSDLDSKSPAYLSFEDKMFDKYDSEVNFPQIFGYEALMVLKTGMESSNSFDPIKVKEAIIDQQFFEGLQGPFEIDAYGDANRPFYMYIIKDGRYEHLNLQ